MAVYYLETSALVKLYVLEPGTDWLLRLVNASSGDRFAVLAVSPIEARSAIRRRERAGDIEAKTAGLILDRMQRHMETTFLVQTLTSSVLDAALEIIDRYALRAYDAIQLAGCLALTTMGRAERPTFVCADRHLLDAARSELLPVRDPCDPD